MWRRRPTWTGAAIASLLLHVLVGAVLLSNDRPNRDPPKPPESPQGIEVVLLEQVPEVASPDDEPRPQIAAADGGGAGAREEPKAEPQPQPQYQYQPRPPTDGAGDEDPDVPAESRLEGGLAISGLRGEARPSPSGSKPPAPVVVQPTPSSRQSAAPRRPELGPTAARDVEPRSLEEAGFQRRKDGSYKKGRLRDPFVAIIEPDGRVRFRDRLMMVKGVAVKPNLVPLQKLAGEEQFRGAKTRILRETAALRLNLAHAWARTQIDRELTKLRTRLEGVWQRTDWSPQRRRRQLFSLWDECEEAPEDRSASESVQGVLDASRRAAGVKAREKIVDFIATKIPEDSADAYPSAELQELNRSRQSRARFEPYR